MSIFDRKYLLGSRSAAPSLDLSFLGGALDPRITFTRASAGSYFDATGTLQSAATNAPRFDYGASPGGTTNWIRNSVAAGSTPGTPGVLPTNWSYNDGATGVVSSVIGTGTESGIPYIDLRFAGTPTATGSVSLRYEGSTQVAATNGQVWTFAANQRLVGGAMTNVSPYWFGAYERSAAGAGVSSDFTVVAVPTSAGLATQRPSVTITLAGGATTAFVMPALLFQVTIGLAVDCTIRLAAPQAEQSASANAWVPTSGAAANSGATPLGLLIEESRTNSLRNPRAEGAVVGTIGGGGAVPTNWAAGALGGVTPSVVGTGTELGVPYIDYRLSGTGAGQAFLYFETGIVASVAQLWTGSIYVRLVAGSLTNVTNVFSSVQFGGGGTNGSALITPTSAALTTQRAAAVATAGVGVATVGHAIGATIAGLVDFTLRIGAPQLELGAFATSLILPPASSPAATTRAIDVASMPLTSAAAMSFAAEAMLPITAGNGFQAVFEMSDGTAANTVELYRNSGTSALSWIEKIATVAVYQPSLGNMTAGTAFKAAASLSAAANNAALNAALASSNTSAVVAGLTILRLGNITNATQTANGYIRRVRYWKRALSGVELKQVTL